MFTGSDWTSVPPLLRAWPEDAKAGSNNRSTAPEKLLGVEGRVRHRSMAIFNTSSL
jgi:hypothetical protein